MIRPSRTMSTCTPAMVSSRKNPMTSASRLRELTACCLSHSPFIVSIRALIRPALSKSSSAAASCISCESSSTNSRWLPERKRSIRLTLAAILLGRDATAARPGPQAHMRIEARTDVGGQARERILLEFALQLTPISAARSAQRHRPAWRCRPCVERRGYRYRDRNSVCPRDASHACI